MPIFSGPNVLAIGNAGGIVTDDAGSRWRNLGQDSTGAFVVEPVVPATPEIEIIIAVTDPADMTENLRLYCLPSNVGAFTSGLYYTDDAGTRIKII